MNALQKLSDSLRERRARFRLRRKPKKDCCHCCVLCKYFDNCVYDLETEKSGQTIASELTIIANKLSTIAKKCVVEQESFMRIQAIAGGDIDVQKRRESDIRELSKETRYTVEEIAGYIVNNALCCGATVEESLKQLRYTVDIAELKGDIK